MKVLIFGASGQVGSALARALPDATALGRADADFSVPNRASEAIVEHRPDVVVNAVAYTAVDKAESDEESARRLNADVLFELALTCAKLGTTLIHYSTDYVFDGTKPEPYDETDETRPLSVYGRTKRAGEMVMESFSPSHLIFRTSWVHGRGGNNFISKIVNLARERDTLRVIDDQVGAPTSAELIAAVTARAIEAMAGGEPIASGTYHLTASGETSFNGYARFIVAEALAAGLDLKVAPDRIEKVPSSAFPSPAQRPLNSRLSTAKLRDALGIDLPDWREGVRDTLAGIVSEAPAR